MGRRLSTESAQRLGASLRERRHAHGLTLGEVARRCGVHHSHVLRIERGEFIFVAPNVQKLCDMFSLGADIAGASTHDAGDLHSQLDAVIKKHPGNALAVKVVLDALLAVQR